MKKFWLDARNWDRDLVTAALESGADAVFVRDDNIDDLRKLGRISIIAENGDIKLGQDVVEVEINSKEDENEALKHSSSKMIIVKTKDWKVIPLENLISQTQNVIASVTNHKEAELALGALESGVGGVLLNTTDVNEIKKVARLVSAASESLELVIAKITNVKQLGMGDRVCVDTCTNMVGSQGMLVGNSSSGMFLVRAENVETPYCAPRPFRVNAGAVHAYIRIPDGKTRYLADLKTGDRVLIVDAEGRTETAFVGRSKIERRPMMLVEAERDEKTISLILQNAETIRLTKPDGQPISVANLKRGDEVLVHIEESGRHFGVKIDETIVEK